MTVILDLAVRSSILLLVGLGACVWLRRRSAAVRHAVLASAMLAGLIVVPLSRAVPAWSVPWPAPPGGHGATAAVPSGAAAPAAVAEDRALAVDADRWLAIAWATGFFAIVGSLLAGLVRLRWLTRRALPIDDELWLRLGRELAAAHGLTRAIAILATERSNLIATWGVLRPRVIVPAAARGWTEARIRMVLGHELAHLRRRDWLVQLGAEVVRAVYWFNPLAWLACRRLRLESEQACDDAVLAAGAPPREYAEELLALARMCRRSVSSGPRQCRWPRRPRWKGELQQC